jgi:outer membrane protein TolC
MFPWVPLSLILLSCGLTEARELALDEAIEIALDRTSRGKVIKGNLEVAEQQYFARRVNFYVPEISINGEIPSYAVDESYRFFASSGTKNLFKTRDLGFASDISLKQSLITGGVLNLTANLVSSNDRYPDTRFQTASGDPVLFGTNVDEKTERGFFRFSLDQPLFRPSEARNNLNNRRDDLEIARLTQLEEEAELKTEIVEAFVGLLRGKLHEELYTDKLEFARQQASIDSLKLGDGILSEEDWLMSTSARLDAELEQFDSQNKSREQKRNLAILLDFDPEEEIEPIEPGIADHIDDATGRNLVAAADESAPVRKARFEYDKAERQADFTAAGFGLRGDLSAQYSLGRGDVTTEFFEGETTDNINTTGWGISLKFSLPIWDGGAGGAEIKAAKLSAEQSRLEYLRKSKRAKADVVDLINKLSIGFRRLGIIRQQIGLAEGRLEIARQRHQNEEISMLTLLEKKISLLETEDSYLEELKAYLVNRITLDSKFGG